MAKRLLYLDTLRGFFIVYVLIIHSVTHFLIHDSGIAVDEVDPLLYYLVFPFIMVGTWAPIFVMVSGTANTYAMFAQMQKYYKNKDQPNASNPLLKIVKGGYINSFFLYLFSLLNMGLFHYGISFLGEVRYSTFTGSIQQGKFALGDPLLLLFSDAIALMSVSGFVVTTFIYILWRKDGYLKIRRNSKAILITGVVWFIISPFMQDWLVPIFYQSVEDEQYLVALILKSVVGVTESTFPNVAFAIFGMAFGHALAEGVEVKSIKQIGYGLGFGFLITAAIVVRDRGLIIGTDAIGHILPMKFHLVNIGIMLLLCTVLIVMMEYQPYEKRLKIAKRTVFLRRFGLVALTAFIMEGFVAHAIRAIFKPLWALFDLTVINIPALAIYVIMVFSFWYGLLRVWEKFDFKYSYEWLLIQIVGYLRGRKSTRLNVQKMLYTPISEKEREIELALENDKKVE